MRRVLLGLFFAGAACAADFQSAWPKDAARPWPGPQYWSNPLQDWRINGGRLECIGAGGDRNVYLLTRDVESKPGTLMMSVRMGRMEGSEGGPGYAGFRLGSHGAFKDYRDSAVRGLGLDTGIAADGRLFIGRLNGNAPVVKQQRDLELRIEARPAGANYAVKLTALDAAGAKLAEVERTDIRPEWLVGGVVLVSHSGPNEPTPGGNLLRMEAGWAGKRLTDRGGNVRFWFRDWKVSGTKVVAHEDRTFGPILWAMHTLSRKVLKLTAQMAPTGNAPQQARLEVKDGAAWRAAGTAAIDPLARTATFRIPKWNDARDTPYRVVYTMEGRQYTFEGAVRKDPVAKPKIVVAAFTGNNDMGFPHADIVKHVSYHKPDFLVYTGDQIYERVGEYGIQREPLAEATLDYLRKWYEFGWEYRDLLKDIPAVCLPDDHDVYHGNLWGAGGRHAEGTGYEGQDKGGYTMPAAWVNMVQRTQTSHMADPYDPTPVDQGITVYYGPMLYGGVSFAVVEDRKWKSAPKEMVPKAQIINGFPQNPDYVAARDGDAKGAQLLGPRQIDFLNKWAADWSGGAWMKAVISQTIFANVATLPDAAKSDSVTGKLRVMKPGEYAEGDVPVMDHDSNGWPQTPRNDALRAMRRGVAFHIAGDQHLGSSVHYGIDDWNDAAWAICVPSVANIFPRRWFPPYPGKNQKPGAPKYTGEFLDGFGNKVTVATVSNPTANGVQPVQLMERAPGYGIITFDRATRKIEMANWPRWVDPSAPGAKPYDGWPVTVDQLDNGLAAARFSLEKVTSEVADPVVQVSDQATGEVAYTLRIQGREFVPKVWKAGVYTVKVFDPDGKYQRVYKDRKSR